MILSCSLKTLLSQTMQVGRVGTASAAMFSLLSQAIQRAAVPPELRSKFGEEFISSHGFRAATEQHLVSCHRADMFGICMMKCVMASQGGRCFPGEDSRTLQCSAGFVYDSVASVSTVPLLDS